jgi:GLPGLI family protein|tara:strand:- start:2385 stop:3239 length:855 start_codon:yes stop_codon:yes gene_type:complete
MNKLLLVVALAISTNSFSQEFQGKAYYQTKTTMDLGSWGSKMSEQQKNMMKDRMKSFLEKTFILTFNKSESIYKEEERLAAPGQGGGGMIAMFAGGAAGEIYKDVKEKIYLQENEFFGKKFLIKDDLPILKWKMGTEQKQIGKYICFKATAVRKVDDLDWRSMRAPKKPKTETDSIKSKKVTEVTEIEIDIPKEVVVTAWYTPQIPVSNGPGESFGLPGLILELNSDKTTILCTKIVLNPEIKEEIVRPTKGDIVSKKEYNDIVKFKMDEMRENRGRGNGRRRF